MATAHFSEGDEVRIIRDVPASPGSSAAISKGSLFVVEDYVSAEEAEDGVAFYWASHGGGMNNAWFPADAAEISRPAKVLADRKVPTKKQIARALGGAISGFPEYDINESDVDVDSVDFYGTTEDGLRFGFRVTVAEAWETDF